LPKKKKARNLAKERKKARLPKCQKKKNFFHLEEEERTPRGSKNPASTTNASKASPPLSTFPREGNLPEISSSASETPGEAA